MYEKVVIAIDLSDASEKIVNKALELVAGDTSKLVLAHAVEPIPPSWGVEAYTIDPLEFQQRLMDFAHAQVAEIGSKAGIDPSQHYVSLGVAVHELRKLVKKVKADAIVMGSHGQGGWKSLLGSTSNKILHGATCDVLTVHIGED
jgi:universal stress protein A